MVNIIIPAYNAHKTIRQTVASVAVQDNQDDIKLTIVDDCSNEPYDYLMDCYKYLNINILRTPFNSGPGQARQYGIDRTDCEYLMFLDADDCLYCPDSVKKLLTTIKKGGYDAVSSIFLEESTLREEYLAHQNDFVWMHGKIYRTQYIKKHSIRFSKTRLNEDNAFNTIILTTGAKIHYIEYVTYIWKNNRDSLTRRGDFLPESINDFIINSEFALNESIRLNAPKSNICDCAVQYLISFYVYYLMFLKGNNDKIFLTNFISSVKKYYRNLPSELKKAITSGKLEKAFYYHPLINMIISQNIIMTVSIYNFIEMIKDK